MELPPTNDTFSVEELIEKGIFISPFGLITRKDRETLFLHHLSSRKTNNSFDLLVRVSEEQNVVRSVGCNYKNMKKYQNKIVFFKGSPYIFSSEGPTYHGFHSISLEPI